LFDLGPAIVPPLALHCRKRLISVLFSSQFYDVTSRNFKILECDRSVGYKHMANYKFCTIFQESQTYCDTTHVHLLRVPKYVVLCCWSTAVAVKSRSDNDELYRDFSVVFCCRCKLLPEAALQNRPPDLVWRMYASDLIWNTLQAKKDF